MTELDSSSAAAATVPTLLDALSEAAPTVAARALASLAVAVIDCAVVCMPAAAVETERTMPLTLRSKSPARLSIAERRSAVARSRVRFRLFESTHAQRVVLEDLDGDCHRADFVAASGAGNVAIQRAIGERLHTAAELIERTADAAANEPCDAARENANDQCGESKQPGNRLQLGIEVIEIGAGAMYM